MTTKQQHIPIKVYSANEFADLLGKNRDAIRKACNKISGYRLPQGWTARKNVSGGWEIHPDRNLLPASPFGSVSELCDSIREMADFLPADSHGNSLQDAHLFRTVRVALFREKWKAYLKDIDNVELARSFRDFEEIWANTLSDQELSEILNRRWERDVRIENLKDLGDGYPKLDSEIGRKGAQGTGKGIAYPVLPPLQHTKALLAVVRDGYRKASRGKEPVELRIVFQQNGSWSIGETGQERQILEDEIPELSEVPRDSLEWLFVATWRIEILIKEELVTKAQWYASSPVSNHRFFTSFRSRCLWCGNRMENFRSNKYYCGDDCRSGLFKWIDERLMPMHKVVKKQKDKIEAASKSDRPGLEAMLAKLDAQIWVVLLERLNKIRHALSKR